MTRLVPFVFAIASALSGGAADFRNLGFEEVGNDPLPAWELFFGDSRTLPLVNPYLAPPDGDMAAIWTGPTPYSASFTEGNFCISFQKTTTSPLWKLSQRGTIPERALFLAYRNQWSEMEVRVNGEKLPVLNPQLGGFAREPTNLMYDVSKYAGQEVQLELIGPMGDVILWPSETIQSYLDSVKFILARISRVAARPEADGSTRVRISFDAVASEKVIVEFRDDLLPTSKWEPLPNQPTDSGSVTDLNVRSQRYYRLRIISP